MLGGVILSSCFMILTTMSLLVVLMMSFSQFLMKFPTFLKDTGLIFFQNSIKESVFFFSVILISFLVFYWGVFYMEKTKNITMFFTALFFFVFSMLLLIFSNNFMMLFLGWEGLGLTSFILIIFYQNWVSFKGGLLTMLTNRLGDVILLVSFSYWVLKFSFLALFKGMAFILTIFLFIISSTKSAQFPFFSWLPAAMAAPTPVSALVHSSTLVTAGIWFLVRFNFMNNLSSVLMGMTGLITLTIASLGALVELDAKKLVALSTLSQLGLMMISLFSSNNMMTFFHLLSHAFAKASLFLMVGSLIHSQFSSQDIRKMAVSEESNLIFGMTFISIMSLTGLSFFSSFYSKDLIILSFNLILSNMMSLILNLIIISLTLMYCIKLVEAILNTGGVELSFLKSSFSKIIPSMVLSFMSLYFGFFFSKNLFLFSATKFSFMALILFFFLYFSGVSMKSESLKKFFSIQDFLLITMTKIFLELVKKFSLSFMILENLVMESSTTLEKMMILIGRLFYTMSMIFLIFLLF